MYTIKSNRPHAREALLCDSDMQQDHRVFVTYFRLVMTNRPFDLFDRTTAEIFRICSDSCKIPTVVSLMRRAAVSHSWRDWIEIESWSKSFKAGAWWFQWRYENTSFTFVVKADADFEVSFNRITENNLTDHNTYGHTSGIQHRMKLQKHIVIVRGRYICPRDAIYFDL